MDKIFNLDYQYSLYLERIALKEEQMSPVQRIETKRAFMGAIGQILLLFRDDIPALPDDQAVAVMEDLFQQTLDFWANAVWKYKLGNDN
ncbi:hypothetical protein GCM10028803_00200 [Larkinella knui]|uniref:Uncharacterized protein n=1 Tax=Larkinella knui TaxID=2025310 RepID=A0A3P1CJL9_9BACT|nr:hypothetical protein [Larkinella knui]RRB13428.1 hypothetical protein EHT87_14220 [Larkinella knui]